MRKYLSTVIIAILLVGLSLPTTTGATIADGTYSINYQVNKPGSNSASMANDYFLKPAKLTVNNGEMTMQLTIKNSTWVTEFKPPGGAKVISSNEAADQRVVQFSISNANLVTIAMKIDIDDIDYHHAYSVDFVFDSSTLPQAKQEEPKQTAPAQTAPATNAGATKPSSGSNTSSNIPAASKGNEQIGSSNEQSSTTTENDESSKSEEQTASTDDEQADQTEVVENPETSDNLPIFALLLFVAALIVFIRTKKIKTIK
jgi:heme uptake protein IsdC